MKKLFLFALLILVASPAGAYYYDSVDAQRAACHRSGGWAHTHLLTGRTTCHY